MDRQYRILIVDDERYNIKALTSILKHDYKIMAARDGESALRAAQGDMRPDLILLDIMMPGIDGYEVCKRLKNDERTKETPVIFVTAVSESMDDARGFSLGAVDYITKPFNPATVQARVNTHLMLSTTVADLKAALSEIKTLQGLLPICSHCKKIREDDGFWSHVETYVSKHSNAQFSHSICPVCTGKYYPDLDLS